MSSRASIAGYGSAAPGASTTSRVRGQAGGEFDGQFGEHLAHSYRLLGSDAEALEAAKAVVQVLPWLDPPSAQLRLSDGGVVARGRARALRPGTALGDAAAEQLMLHIKLSGDSVDVAVSAAQASTIELILAAREDLAGALARRGLKLRHLSAADPKSTEEEPEKAPKVLDPSIYRRSYVEVIV